MIKNATRNVLAEEMEMSHDTKKGEAHSHAGRSYCQLFSSGEKLCFMQMFERQRIDCVHVIKQTLYKW